MSIYSIGHGRRSKEQFLEVLKKNEIKYLIDVRSVPFSKWSPDYNKESLKKFLELNEIAYIFMGDSIGGRPEDESCYDIDGRVDYEKLREKDFFLQGIDRVKTANDKGLNVALMCSESKPTECHRSKLIGRVLVEREIIMQHIDENDKIKDQGIVIGEINKGLPDKDLFGNSMNYSKKAYKKKENEEN